MGEATLVLLILLSLLIIFCLYKMLDKRGLYFTLVLLNLISLVLSFKIAYILKMNVNLGIVPFISSLSVIYIFINKYGYKEIKHLIKVSLYANISAAILIAIMNFFIPAITETISINMQGTFEYNYKILIAYPIMTALSQFLVAKLYKLVATLQNNVALCMSLTYVITALIYTVIINLVYYINIIEIKYSLFLGVSNYILGLAITIINVFFVNYIIKSKKVKS